MACGGVRVRPSDGGRCILDLANLYRSERRLQFVAPSGDRARLEGSRIIGRLRIGRLCVVLAGLALHSDLPWRRFDLACP